MSACRPFLVCLLLTLLSCSALADDNDSPALLFRPSQASARISGLMLVSLDRFERKDRSKAMRLTLLFDPRGRSLFAEHIALFSDPTGKMNKPHRIEIEIGIKHHLTPVRLAAISHDGKTEAETWLLEDGDEGGGRGGVAMCPPPPPPPPPYIPPPLDQRVSVAPSVFAFQHHAVDKNTGAAINLGSEPSYSIGVSGGFAWGRSLESIAEVTGGGYDFSDYPGGVLLDKSISYWSFGTGIRYYLTDTKTIFAEALAGYDRRFYIRGAGSGYLAAAPFDFPEFTLRIGGMIIVPRPWGFFAQAEGNLMAGLWKSNLTVQSGYGGTVRLQAVLRHPLAQIRGGFTFGYESIGTNLVNIQNQRYGFELALDWEL